MIDDYKGISLPAAKIFQEQARQLLKFETPDDTEISTIAGADISFNKNSTKLYAAIVVLSYPEMKLKSFALATGETDFPYVSGYLGFREVPTLLKAWKLLINKPTLVMLDGQGILHPRRMGIAAHFGVLTKCATIGCAKSALYGFYEEPAILKKSYTIVYEKPGLTPIGYALRTKNATKPVYISPGYGLSLPNSLSIAIKCIGKYRIPEPTRIAHQIVNDFRLGKLKGGLNIVTPQQELF